MKDYDPVLSFGADSARAHDLRGDEEEAVAFLASLAGRGPALELAIGTGRIALPLAARGLRVDGIDIAPAMLERLREKPGGAALDVRLGDFADVDVPGRYPLVFVLWNSFYNLLSQDEQVRCLQNVAARLEPGGAFVVEGFVPAFLHRLERHQRVETEAIEVDAVRLGAMRHDPALQRLEQTHVDLTAQGLSMTPVVQRYVWPAELDLMARIAGLRLEVRYGGFRQEPFDADSRLHVSVYRR